MRATTKRTMTKRTITIPGPVPRPTTRGPSPARAPSASRHAPEVREQARSSARSSARAGIALVTVLMALAAILMLGVGTMVLTNANLMVAQNLAGSAVARANAEAGIDATMAAMRAAFEADGTLPVGITAAPTSELPSGTLDYAFAEAPRWHDQQVVIRVVGYGPRNAEYVSEARLSFGGAATGGGSPFTGAVVGCEGVTLQGSGTIDSFDSRLGLYDTSTRGWNASVSTVSPGALVLLTGNAPIYGPVNSTGGVRATGSSSVYGDVNASGLVQLQANARYAGDVRTTGNVELTNTATIDGAISANGDITFGNGAKVGGSAFAGGNIAFNNSGARVGGDAHAGGTITRGHGDASVRHVAGASLTDAGPVANQPVPSDTCDPLGIADVMAAFEPLPSSGDLSTGYPFNEWEFSPAGVRHYDETWNVKAWTDDASRVLHDVTVFGREVGMIKTDDLNLGNGELRITGGDVVLFVDGDLKLGTGGGDGLVIDEDSSLTVFVTGKTLIGSSVQMDNLVPVSPSGVPTFSLYSDYDRNQTSPYDWGIKVQADSRLTANIYAPLTNVSVNAGGGLYGGARGRRIQVTGDGDLHYDEALGAVDIGGGEGSTTPTGLQLISRR